MKGNDVMKVLLVNGSAKPKGCTYTALCEIASELEKNGIEAEIFHIGTKPIAGCLGCKACVKLGKCIQEDIVNEALEKFKEADGYVFGTPVHYAAASGGITSFLDRMFYSNGKNFADKPGAVIVSCRRGGASAAFDQLNKYLTISNMPVVSSQYWSMVHGNTPEEVIQDLEGMQTMRTLAKNMAWLLKCIEAGDKAGIERPQREAKINTNYIR